MRAYICLTVLGTSILALIVLGILYTGEGLWVYSAMTVRPAPGSGLVDFFVPTGPLYPLFAALLLITTVGALLNLELGRRHGAGGGIRGPFARLLGSGFLYAFAGLGLGVVNWLAPDSIPIWVGHAALGLATAIFAWTVAAHSLLVNESTIPGDFVYFLCAVGLVCGIYGLVFWLARPAFSMTQLAVVAAILSAAILTHALVDVGRRALDRLFFDADTRRLRASLSGVVQAASLARNVDSLIVEASDELVRAQADRLIGLTEHALRVINSPSRLANCALIERLPLIVAEQCIGLPAAPTPLEQARGLREALVAAVDQLKFAGSVSIGDPAALQYILVRQEYFEGLPNKQIMARLGVSASIFHRIRREAIESVARELSAREEGHAASVS